MIEITIPGRPDIQIKDLVLDYNGTLACDGHLLKGVKERIKELSYRIDVHVITADTFGNAKEELKEVDCQLVVIGRDNQDVAKERFIEKLGTNQTAAIGNGRNDLLMLKNSAIGILVIQEEGAATASLATADIVCTHINNALDLLLNPKRIAATLRN